SVVETAEFGFNGKSFDRRGEDLLKQWVSRSGDGRVVMAIGNGKASFETQVAVAGMIRSGKFMPKDVRFCTVPENGASKYSITPLAEQDLPDMPPTQRSAVSIGRRLIDPMAEYVKIDPKHLGMGMYQHSVNAKRLSEALELVVRECVSLRGVDVNVASVQLLEKVCGLNKKTAAGLVALREKMGRIQSREDIKSVKGLGAKSFEQCAGFLTVNIDCENGSNGPVKKKKKMSIEPLDKTIVHPSQYNSARSRHLPPSVVLAAEPPSKILSQSAQEKKLADGCSQDWFTKGGRRSVGKGGQPGRFWALCRHWSRESALAHRSTLRQPYPEVGTSLMFVITNVDQSKGRIGVRPVN
ncbi:competence protein ComEA helix-hairpin-helix repeat region, partial [Ostertagia ostertagi]